MPMLREAKTMRDLFERWATSKTPVTTVTPVTPAKTLRPCGAASSGEPVTGSDGGPVTPVTGQAPPTEAVTGLTGRRTPPVTRHQPEKPKRSKAFPDLLPLSPLSPRNERCALAECLALLAEMHAGIRAVYPAGALAVLDTDPDLRKRFRATEAAIDEAARLPGGPMEADFRAAVEAHAAVWGELIARHRARADRESMPELPEGTRLAIGFSYGDGEPGSWAVVR